MKFTNLLNTFALILILSFSSTNAGQLSIELEDKISSSTSDEIIPVLIKLHRLEPINQLKARSESQAQTRNERHQFVQKHFQEGHRKAQVQLVDHLSRLTKRGAVKNVKQFWIVNLIAADIKASEIEQLASRDDIEWIYPVIEPKLIAPVDVTGKLVSPLADTIASNIIYVKADLAWGMGYTGAGRVICSFDTGVDGDHPALFNQWKGHDGDSASAWFDPKYNQTFPHAPAGAHGTHTMGTMIGWDNALEYRMGVAPDAKWISAAVINITGASVIDAFQWAADPDGNPNTIADVPDVINHSWGYSKSMLACENLVFDLIDNTEALGIVNVFASGNRFQEASADTMVFNPANRDLSPTDCFAVGNLNTTLSPPLLHSKSLGGPSDCNGGIKPNVVAPGAFVISSFPGDGYGSMSGTSMAAPHVSGLVLLLREKNPNATPDEIKQAIIASTQAEGSWGALPNNSYGYGAIDCVAALNQISDNSSDFTSLRVYEFNHLPISPGNTVTGTITLQNLGITATNVTATLTGSNPSLTIIDGTVNFGTININSTSVSSSAVKVVVSDTVTPGTQLTLGLLVSGDGVSQNLSLYFLVGDPSEKGIAHHDNGTIKFTLSNYGVLGLGSNSMYQADGFGFTYNSATNDLWEAGVIIGTSASQISSGIHSYFDRPNMDFKVMPGGDMAFFAPGNDGAEESLSAFNDDWTNNPIGLSIKQHSFSYDYPNDNFIVIKYTLENFSGSNIDNLYFGLLLDWDISNAISNSGGYNASNDLLWMAYNSAGSLSKFRGMKSIHGKQSGALTESATDVSWLKFWNQNADGFTDAEKWASLKAGMPASNPYENTSDDLFQMMNFGPYNLAHGASTRVTIAILAGDSLADLQAASEAAMLVPTGISEEEENNNNNPSLPDKFYLYQNYPNPFNPKTTIRFDLNQPAQYQLTIYNVLGQNVHEVSRFSTGGTITEPWDASNHASGTYFYRVSTDQFSDTKKMLLLK